MRSIPEEELKQFARDYCQGLIFTSRNIHEQASIGTVFMVLHFLDDDYKESIREDLGMVYEYMEKALPMQINGCPVFMSCRLVSKTDEGKAWAYVKKIQEATEQALK